MRIAVFAGSDPEASFSLLETFFLGRAFAQTVNERLGAAVADMLSEMTRKAGRNPGLELVLTTADKKPCFTSRTPSAVSRSGHSKRRSVPGPPRSSA